MSLDIWYQLTICDEWSILTVDLTCYSWVDRIVHIRSSALLKLFKRFSESEKIAKKLFSLLLLYWITGYWECDWKRNNPNWIATQTFLSWKKFDSYASEASQLKEMCAEGTKIWKNNFNIEISYKNTYLLIFLCNNETLKKSFTLNEPGKYLLKARMDRRVIFLCALRVLYYKFAAPEFFTKTGIQNTKLQK